MSAVQRVIFRHLDRGVKEHKFFAVLSTSLCSCFPVWRSLKKEKAHGARFHQEKSVEIA